MPWPKPLQVRFDLAAVLKRINLQQRTGLVKRKTKPIQAQETFLD